MIVRPLPSTTTFTTNTNKEMHRVCEVHGTKICLRCEG